MGQPPSSLQPPSQSQMQHQQNIQYQQYMQQQLQLQQQQMSRDDSLHKLKKLDEISSSVAKISHLLIQFFDEITKDKQPTTKVKQIKSIFEEFLKHLKKVESDLLHEINLLSMASTGNPHEGSIYGARKDYDLSKMQLHLISSQINSLRSALSSPLGPEEESSDDSDDEEDRAHGLNTNGLNGHATNGHSHTNGHANGHTNGYENGN
jgi:mediator of RNA polymerase II transcription subunit 11